MKKIPPATPEIIAELKSQLKANQQRLASRMKFLRLVDTLGKYQFINVQLSEKEYRKYKTWAKTYSQETGKVINVRMISDEVFRISRV